MNKNIAMALGMMCLVFLFTGAARSEGPEPAPVGKCPEVLDFETKIRAKRSEIADVDKQIKALGREQKAQADAERILEQGEKRARLESLKQNDPAKYERERTKQFELQMKRAAARKLKAQERGTQSKMTHEQWLARLETKNPGMFELVTKKDFLLIDLNTLRSMMQDARQECKSKE
ncbi:MAG: hypothetical protein WCY10_01275 [Candidatus Omnitrophota bacterium]